MRQYPRADDLDVPLEGSGGAGTRTAAPDQDRCGALPALEARLRELHPYEMPEFLVLPVASGSAAYLRWVGESTTAPG